MSNCPEEVENAIEALTGSCNITLLHPLDKERIVEVIWEFTQKDSLNECDIQKLAREKFNWGTRAADFLKWTVEVIEVLHPMAKRGEIKL